MSNAVQQHFSDRWIQTDGVLTDAQHQQLANVYQLMLAARFNDAEQQLSGLAKQVPAVLPMWVSLLTELQQFDKIRQLTAEGLLDAHSSSAVLAEAYAQAPLAQIRFSGPHATIPLQSHWLVPLPRIKVTLNKKTYYFVLDTGASQSLVTDKVVRELSLPLASVSKVSIDTATANTVLADLVQLPPFQLGNVIAEHQVAVVVRRAELEQRLLGFSWYQLDGIIGWPVIKQLDLTIDFAAEQLEIRQPVAGAKRGNLVWLFDDPMVIADSQQAARLWFLDTGAMESQLTTDYLSTAQYQSVAWRHKKFNGLGGKGEAERTGQFGPVQIDFPSITQHFKQLTVRAGHQDCRYSRCDGRLGVDSAAGLRMHINFQSASFDISSGR